MNYSGITKCDTANGLGCRTTLWVSGCRCQCPGCHNPQTWDFKAGQEFTESAKEELFIAASKPYIAGLTFSGGNPLEPENTLALSEIAKEFKQLCPEKTIWIYCGNILTFKDIYGPGFGSTDRTQFAPKLFRYCDVIVDGPFIQSERDITLAFRGSRNQRIIDIKKTYEQGEIVCLNL